MRGNCGGIEYFVSVEWRMEVAGLAVGICGTWGLKETNAIESDFEKGGRLHPKQTVALRAGVRILTRTKLDGQLRYTSILALQKSNYC